jgi:hypothetical protein
MSTNGFRQDELVTKKVKVNGEWQTRTFPVVAGRLRLAHEENGKLSLQTELVNWNGDYAVFKCVAMTEKGQFVGYGTANNQRDARLAESLIELAETRSIARALRFAGFGMEFCGAEEVSHVADGEAEPTSSKDNGNGEPVSGGPNGPTVKAESEKRIVRGQATQAQVRALYALTKRNGYDEGQIDEMLQSMNTARFEELSREDASRLISHLQTAQAI